MGRIALGISLSALILALGTPAGWAQEKPAQQQQEPATQKPKDTRVSQPATPQQPISSDKARGQAPASEKSRSRSKEQGRKPLSGVEQYTLSTMGRDRSYFYPVFQVAEGADTNPDNQFSSSTIESVSMLSGSFATRDVWSRYTFLLNYAGSGFIYNQDPSLSLSAHSFNISQTITGRRSSLLLTDAVSYLPEASFGYDRFSQYSGLNGGPGGLYGVDTSGLSGVYLPNQSVLTGTSSRISNATVGQYSYDLSPLSSLTFTGAYKLLRFPDSGFVDSNAGILGFGYNHEIGRKDTLAMSYFASLYRYVNQPDFNFTNHVVELMYGHQITQLLSLDLGGGPSINIFGNGLNGDTGVSWYANANLRYRLPRQQLTLHYSHYTTAGAGVFFGSQTDNVGVRIAEQITRLWSGDVGLGYSYNKDLRATAGSSTFNTWYASANLRKRLGRSTSMFLSYNLQQQISNNPFCIGSNCGTFYTRQYFSLGFNWHPRAIDVTEEQRP